MTTASTTAALADVRDALRARHDRTRADLEALVRIPSVSTAPDPSPVRRSAEAVRDLLAARGFARARLLEVDGAHPAVTAEVRTAPPGAPTVLLYAHHDVQPAGDPAAWTSPPFDPTTRDGRLYGRGAADDKAGIAVHVAAVAAWLEAREALPVDVVVLVEGEEESGSAHLDTFLERYGEDLRADVVVVTDSVNWAVGVPSLTYLLRGNLVVDVSVAALDHGVHSGMYGGPVPDAVTGLVRLLATLTDEHGAVAVARFADDARPLSERERAAIAALDFDERAFRAEAGLLDGVQLIGDPAAGVLERLWARPTATVTGIDAPPVAEASNTLVPAARARVSLRLAPGQDPGRAAAVLRRHLEAATPWGLHLDVAEHGAAPPWVADPDVEPTRTAMAAAERALAAAFGRPPVRTGVGGSIPFLPAIVERLGDPAVLLTGVEDPDTRAHGVDESLHLGDFAKACLAEAYLFAELAGGGAP